VKNRAGKSGNPCLGTDFQIFRHGFSRGKQERACMHVKLFPVIMTVH